MKILVCHNFYQQQGGEDLSFADEASLLEDRGHQVVRYTVHNDSITNMSHWRIAGKTFWNRDTYRQVRELIRQERPELMHCTNTFPLLSPSVYYAAKAENLPVLQALRNYRLLCPSACLLRDQRVCEDCTTRLFAWPAIRHRCYKNNRLASGVVAGMLTTHRLLRTWSRKVDLYYTLTEFARQKYIQCGWPAERMVVKPNFVSLDAPLGLGEEGYAIYVGRLSQEKGISLLLEAWRQSPQNLPLHIIGDGPLAPDVQRACQADPRIQWLGKRPSQEVIERIGRAACLILPSICYETFGRTIIEAYCVGTPAIVSRQGAMQELVTHEVTGLHFEPGQAASLREAVQRLMSDMNLQSRLRAAARQAYEVHYTADRNYQLLMNIYQRLLQRPILASRSDRKRRAPVEQSIADLNYSQVEK